MSFYRRRWEQPRTYTCNLIGLWLFFRVDRSGVRKLPLRCNSWMHPVWRAVCQIVCGIGAMRVNSGNSRSTRGDGTSQWPLAPSLNGTVIGISEITVSISNDSHRWSSWFARADNEGRSSWSPWSRLSLRASRSSTMTGARLWSGVGAN